MASHSCVRCPRRRSSGAEGPPILVGTHPGSTALLAVSGQNRATEISEATGDERSPEEVAEGFVAIAVADMANAVKKISVAKGHDVTAYALTTFGGAGGQHACAVADALGMRTVLVPRMAGVLSALGMGLADITAMREQSVEEPLDDSVMARVESVADSLASTASAELGDQEVPEERVTVIRRAHLRYDGTDTAVQVDLGSRAAMTAEFEAHHRRLYSFLMDRRLIVEAVSVEAVGWAEQVASHPDEPESPGRAGGEGGAATARLYTPARGATCHCTVAAISGPAPASKAPR